MTYLGTPWPIMTPSIFPPMMKSVQSLEIQKCALLRRQGLATSPICNIRMGYYDFRTALQHPLLDPLGECHILPDNGMVRTLGLDNGPKCHLGCLFGVGRLTMCFTDQSKLDEAKGYVSGIPR